MATPPISNPSAPRRLTFCGCEPAGAVAFERAGGTGGDGGCTEGRCLAANTDGDEGVCVFADGLIDAGAGLDVDGAIEAKAAFGCRGGTKD